MKAYKHNDDELLSDESERILHKNAKTVRIQKEADKKKKIIREAKNKAFMVSTVAFLILLFYVGGIMTRYMVR